MVLGILAGPSIHLWYLPFSLFTLLAFDVLRSKMNPPAMACGCALLSIVALATAAEWNAWFLEQSRPVAQYVHAANAVLIGVFLGYYRTLAVSVRSLLLLGIVAAISFATLPIPGFGVPYLIGVCVSAVVLLPDRRLPAWFNIQRLADCTLGIYLVHPFYLMLLHKLKPIWETGVPILAFVASAISICLIRSAFPNASRFAV
jgi:hypothetical protein